MKFFLNSQRSVSLCSNRVSFHFKTRCCVRLSRRQFFNLDDIVCNMKHLRLHNYPLDNHLWLQHTRNSTYLSAPDAYFRFHPKSLERYIRDIHPVIRFILIHGKRESYQRDALHARSQHTRPRRITSQVRRETFSRTTRNVTSSDEQREKRTTLPTGYDSNTRSTNTKRSRRHAQRTP